jgi:uncharacterized membrane protein YkvA (DUF1232 family)
VSELDPFPGDAFGALLRRLPAYGRLAWRLGRDPLISRARRAAVIGAAGYLVSPIDLVPGFIPVLGQLDDIAVVLAALRLALDGLDPDLRALGSTGAWVGRAGLRTSGRLARAGIRATVGGTRRITRAARSSRLLDRPRA